MQDIQLTMHGLELIADWPDRLSDDYHFGKGEKSQEDKDHRNETQVVTKFANIDDERTERQENTKAEKGKPDKWTVLRVNQLWIWTLADSKLYYLITSLRSAKTNDQNG